MIDGTTLGVALGLLQISNRKNTDRIVAALQPPARRVTCGELAAAQAEAAKMAATAARIRYYSNQPELPEPPPAAEDLDSLRI